MSCFTDKPRGRRRWIKAHGNRVWRARCGKQQRAVFGSVALGADGGYSFISSLAEDNHLAVRSLSNLKAKLTHRGIHPLFIIGHTGWTDNSSFAFAHADKLCSLFKKRTPDPAAPYDAYDESDDTEEHAKAALLKPVGQ